MAPLCLVERNGEVIGTSTWAEYQAAYTERIPLRFRAGVPGELGG